MKKTLIVGIGEENNPKQHLVLAIKKMGLLFVYKKWSDLSFYEKDVYFKQEKINFNHVDAVIFDIFRFPIINKEKNSEFNYNLENEFNVLLGILKERKIYTPNHMFFSQYPFYNKFSQMHIFDTKKIPHIPTLHISDNKPEKVLAALKKHNISFPLVAKESYGGGGNNVWKIKNKTDLVDFLEKRRSINIVFQPYIKNDSDYRVIIVGKKCLGIMKRSAQKGQWKNNFSLGGNIEKWQDKKMEKFAIAACKKINLDMAGFDILRVNNKFVVIETNLFFGLDGFQTVYPEINVAEKIINLVNTNKTI
jgi:hypothetical protein